MIVIVFISGMLIGSLVTFICRVAYEVKKDKKRVIKLSPTEFQDIFMTPKIDRQA